MSRIGEIADGRSSGEYALNPRFMLWVRIVQFLCDIKRRMQEQQSISQEHMAGQVGGLWKTFNHIES
jgi:hypothetical protein